MQYSQSAIKGGTVKRGMPVSAKYNKVKYNEMQYACSPEQKKKFRYSKEYSTFYFL